MSTKEYSAFLSHSSKDAAIAAQWAEAIEAKGHTVWIAPRDVRPGAEWAEEIMRGIQSSKCFILLLSDAANFSDNVRREVERAANYRKPIYPVRIEEVPPSPKLEYFISMHHWIDALEGLGEDVVARLVQSLDSGEHMPGVAPVRAENPFAVPSTYRGPLLPEPKAGEVWKEALPQAFRVDLKKTKMGTPSGNWAYPTTVVWCDEDKLMIGANKAIYEVNTRSASMKKRYWIRWFQDKHIHDFGCIQQFGELFIVGSDMSLATSSSSSFAWSGSQKSDFVSNPDFDRAVTSPTSFRFRGAVRVGRHSLRHFPEYATDGVELRFETEGFIMWEFKLAWSPSKRFLALFQGLQGTSGQLPIFDLEGSPENCQVCPLLFPDEDGRTALAATWHPTRDLLAVTYRGKDFEPPYGFLILDVPTGEILLDQQTERPNQPTCVDWSPDGRYLAMGGYDHAVVIWDFDTGRAERLLGHKDQLTEVHFSPDGQRLASFSDDRKGIIWGCVPGWPKLAEFDGVVKTDAYIRFNGSPWSADGRRLAAISDTLTVMQLD